MAALLSVPPPAPRQTHSRQKRKKRIASLAAGGRPPVGPPPGPPPSRDSPPAAALSSCLLLVRPPREIRRLLPPSRPASSWSPPRGISGPPHPPPPVPIAAGNASHVLRPPPHVLCRRVLRPPPRVRLRVPVSARCALAAPPPPPRGWASTPPWGRSATPRPERICSRPSPAACGAGGRPLTLAAQIVGTEWRRTGTYGWRKLRNITMWQIRTLIQRKISSSFTMLMHSIKDLVSGRTRSDISLAPRR
ncbi:formin-like protein 14 [Panicum virgatum]|uniref:formin-like protein 14 n=1 Tax=Panicum virgatum TaxID=38727 RepID=UPI0019D61B2F|nr:formin-like protein 14 [Panicum virgatum]